MPDPSSRRSRALELFEEYLTRRAAGEKVDFESLCNAHPDHAAELRSFKVGLDAAERAAPAALDSAPLSERLKRQFGPTLDPSLALEAEPKPDAGPPSKLFGKLLSEGPRGTRYKLLGEIARGGMGAIIRIWDDELRRTLAMKVVLGKGESATGETPSVDPRMLGRFLEEAQVTGQLDHPGIVPVHELGLASDGRVYFTMRLVKGEDLRAIFKKVRTGDDGWSQVRALGVMLKVCEAMSYAHSKQVVHRDLKPANVMVGKFGEVYVMDWGLARVLGREDKHDLRIKAEVPSSFSQVKTERREKREEMPDSPLITMDGDVVGTPSFMPPEQAKGQLDKLGAHSDVYALGAMLYQLIGGEMPYAPKGELISQRTILARLLDGPPQPLDELAPQTPGELIAIAEKAMAREITDRYATMQALADDLRAYIEGRVVHAYETGAWAEARKWVKRNKPLAASIAAAVLAVLIGGVSFALKAKEATAARDELATKNTELAASTKVAQQNATRATEQEQIAIQRAADLAVATKAAQDNESRAIAQERLATQKTNDVLSLSASKDLEELVARAEKLWPAHPEMISEYEKWLAEARALIDGRPGDPAHDIKKRPSLEEHKAKLADLRGRATKQSEEEAKAARESHPRFEELTAKRAELTWRSRMLELEPWPNEAEVEAQLAKETLPTDANGLNTLAWPLVDSDKPVYGNEVRGLLLAKRAVAAATDSERSGIRDSLAWANFRLGRLDEAVAEEERAVDEAPADKTKEFEGYVAKMEKAVERWKGEAALAARRTERDALLAEVSDLDRVVSERRTWAFEKPEDAWWQVQLSKLVSDLEALRDPKTGLMGDTLAEPFGWGVRKRYEFAKTIAERSVQGPEAQQRWAEAIASIASSPKYGGLQMTPQLGVVPIGEDPESHLWEFAHLQTGEPAMRGADGKLVLSQETGLVFVLIPGGTFWMGAQKKDPTGQNFDAGAGSDESPVHEVELSAYFLSKYEMTQGQWQRIAARNPSAYGPSANFAGHQHNLLHPVEQVSWDESMGLMARLGLSLPSEAQWENGCRGGTATSWWTGQERESLRGKVNIADKTASDAGATWGDIKDWPDLVDGWVVHAAVGSFPANPFGLDEVHGNVWEWCADGYDGRFYAKSPKTDPFAPIAGSASRVVRGGSFNDAASYARSAPRNSNTPVIRTSHLGLRPARASLLSASPLHQSGK